MHKRPFHRKKILVKRYRVNDWIRLPRIVLIDEQGQHLGEMDTSNARQLAVQKGLDLVEVNPTVRPPICKLMNFGQFLYQQSKAAAKQKAKIKKVAIKGIRLTFKISEHDLSIRQQQTEKFLAEGHKVNIELRLRGRENAHLNLAFTRVKNFIAGLGADIQIEQPAKKLGNTINTIIYLKK